MILIKNNFVTLLEILNIMIFSLSDGMLDSLTEMTDKQIKRFTTSADVVMKASGLRLEAIRAIAREVGIKIEETESRCIDENLLSLLADAHVRQLKSYFNKSKRHLAELTGAELTMFADFCETFKKRQSDYSVLSWDNIDADIIREQFLKKVHSLTQNQDLPLNPSGKTLFEIVTESLSLETYDLDTFQCDQQKDFIVNCLLNNRWLYMQCKELYIIRVDRRSQVKRVTQSSRYYIYPDENSHIAC